VLSRSLGALPRGKTLAAVIGLLVLAAAFASLASWQLRRANESRATAARFAVGATADALRAPPAELEAAERFRRLRVAGAYLEAPQFLLDNMVEHGEAGYHVLTLLRVDGSERWLLVNRGWVGVGPDRRVLPDVRVDPAPRRVSGRLERLPEPGLRLAAAEPGAAREAVTVVEFPTAAELAARAEHAVFDYELKLDAGEPDGFEREWRPPGLGPERHWAYAGQWTVFALGAAAAAAVLAIRQGRRRAA
jgi:surfeit locus 1 family protein